MKCSCCGRKKKLFESFENIGKGREVCVDCSDILYRIHDAVSEKNSEEYDANKKKIEAFFSKQASKEFKDWFKNDYLIRNKRPDAATIEPQS